MAEERDIPVLKRKAEAGRPAADGAPMTPERAIAQALGKVAQDQMKLPLQLRELSQARRSLADLPEMLEELSLLAVIEGPGDALGLVAVPPGTLSALIEMQTMGRLAKSAPPPRKPTRIDAAMAAEYIDAVLAAIEEALAFDEAVTWAGGFRFASHLDDPRPLGLLLEDIGYRVWTAKLAFGAGGEREGGFLWAVPATGRGPKPRRASPPGVAGAAPPDDPVPADEALAQALHWQEALETVVLGAQATLDGVLHRITLPLSAVMGFAPGTQIPLPEDALERIVLEASGRRNLSLARLGQARGFRALRLLGDESPPGVTREMSGQARARRAPQSGMAMGDSPLAQVDLPALDPMGPGDPLSAASDGPTVRDAGGMGGLGEGMTAGLSGPEDGDEAAGDGGFPAMSSGGPDPPGPGEADAADAAELPPLRIGLGS